MLFGLNQRNCAQSSPAPVKLHLASPDGVNTIRRCSGGLIRVNQTDYDGSLVVLPDQLIDEWGPSNPDELQADHFTALVGLEPELVLLGTGASLRFPKPELTRSLVEAGIGLEVMDTTAACRTYNIVMGEGRRVAAALINPPTA